MGSIDRLIISGGGSENETMVSEPTKRCSVPVNFTDAFGIPAETKEALGFAVLAYETYRGVLCNVPYATGAHKGVWLGKVSPAGGN